MTTVQKHKGVLDPETGWMVTPQEAYLPEEWAEHANTCRGCGEEFVLYTSGDEEVRLSGRRGDYCSNECASEAHRQQSRDYARRVRAARLAVN